MLTKNVLVATILSLHIACVPPETMSLLEQPSDDDKLILEPWLEEFRKDWIGPDEFEEYRFASINQATLEAIRDGQIKRFMFNYSESLRYAMTVSEVGEKESNWYFSANADSLEHSLFVLSIFPSGEVRGTFHATGIGSFIFNPTNTLPYVLIHLGTGTYVFD